MPNYPRRRGVCRCCGVAGMVGSRDLTPACYGRALRDDKLADYPRLTRSLADLLADYILLHGEGYNARQIAARLDYKLASMQRQLYRAQARGVITIRNGVIQL